MPQLKCLVLILFLLAIPQTVLGQDTFRFAVFSDSRGDRSTSECAADNYGVSPLLEIVRDHLLRVNESNAVSLVVFPGDMISGMLKRDAQSTAACNRIQLEHWRKTIKPIMDRGILIRVTTGNHDAASVDLTRGVTRCGDHGWPYTPNRENFEVVRNLVGDMILGAPGPASDLGMTYSFDAGGCHFAVLAAYTMFENNSFSNETLKWLDSDLAQARRAGLKLFVASHPPAFPGGGHMWNSLSFFDPSYTCNDYSGIDRRKERDRFWN
ncbi:MAG: metallophosphoesterase, partial [Deltaproteobacteria bacterium]|nr:metallophosphoesterase [Deltaproteobacteria bacterium]